MISIENTHNRCGGTVLTSEYTLAIAEIASSHGAALHIDGARIFNAAVALGLPVKLLANVANTVSFCLSKGLSCPVGSLICGSKETIAAARKNRKMTRALLVSEVANYDFGIGDSGDLFQALIIYTRVLSGYYDSVYNFNLLVAKFDRDTNM